MMYPRNAASPERIALGQVVLISDGTVQSSGVAITVRGQGGAEASGGGTTAYGADNTVYYTPTQAETDYTSFVVIASKVLCFSVSATIPTSLNRTAFDNLEDMYDGTGYTDDTAPASRSQVSGIGSGSAGSVNIKAVEDNSSAGIDPGTVPVTKVGTITGDFNNLHAVTDGASIVSIAGVGNDIGYVTGYYVGTARAAVSASITANLNGNTDSMLIKAYNHITGDLWDTVGVLSGTGGASYISFDVPLYPEHTGTGAEAGKVYLQFDNNGTTPNLLEIDRCSVSAVSNDGGIANGSTVTLSASMTNMNFIGNNWNLVLGNQSITGSYIRGARVTGISSGSGVTFEDCKFGAGTYPPGTYIRCGFGDLDGLFTAASAGQYVLKDCYSIVEGSGSPDFTFAGLGSATGINNRGWFGGSAWTLDTNCVMSHEVLAGGGTTITPADAAVEVRGACRSLTLALADTDVGNTLQCHIDTGPVTITSAGSSDSATINLYGSAQSITDGSSVGTTVNPYMSGYVQTNSIKVKTDQMVFTNANELDANTKSINDAEVVGDGNATPWDGA
ncbi:MAG: hypothetical protein GY941_15775 [Planctomycetes bacterium]|nr:hypothetical protein [Planctomycetota bacterium]